MDEHNQAEDQHLVASIEDDLIAQSLPSRSTFIPLRHNELQTRLAQCYSLNGNTLGMFRQFCKRLQAIFHVEHLAALLHLEEIYSPLDPDENLIELEELDDQQRDESIGRLFDRLCGLLYSAHYKRLTREELERAIEIGSVWGVKLDVDFSIYDRLEIFARGYRVVEATRRRWQNFYRTETIELPEFQRLIMAFKLKPSLDDIESPENVDDDGEQSSPGRMADIKKRLSEMLQGDDSSAIVSDRVYLKTFKNIPETDLEILLPGSKIRLTMLDRGKILFPTAMALYKLVRFVAAISFLFVAVAYSLSDIIASLILLGAIFGYLAKSILSYFRTKTKYQFGLTKSLYLKNLGNNSGVIYRILNEAEEQELLETMLGYTTLWQIGEAASAKGGKFNGMTELELDKAVETFLMEQTGVDIDFEIHDALGKMARLGLANVDSSGRWSAVSLESAAASLNDNWSRLFESRNLKAISGETVDEDLFTS